MWSLRLGLACLDGVPMGGEPNSGSDHRNRWQRQDRELLSPKPLHLPDRPPLSPVQFEWACADS
jgi:hypothetical protein